jgi:hypothetical protein
MLQRPVQIGSQRGPLRDVERRAGDARYFITGEDLTTQAGLAVQQDLALVNLIGLRHVERNGHHYVNGMASLPEAEQQALLTAHPDLYERSCGAVRLKIRDGLLDIGSLAGPGFAAGAYPDWKTLSPLANAAKRFLPVERSHVSRRS